MYYWHSKFKKFKGISSLSRTLSFAASLVTLSIQANVSIFSMNVLRMPFIISSAYNKLSNITKFISILEQCMYQTSSNSKNGIENWKLHATKEMQSQVHNPKHYFKLSQEKSSLWFLPSGPHRSTSKVFAIDVVLFVLVVNYL